MAASRREHALDHRVEDVAGKVERALELRREVALVHLAVALDLGPVLPVELDGRDPLAADLGDDLAGLVLVRARARPEDEPEDENADHGEQRPLQVVEAVAHRLEHRKPLRQNVRERATIAGDSIRARQARSGAGDGGLRRGVRHLRIRGQVCYKQ